MRVEVCTAAGCGLAASAGHETLSVYRAPRVGIISLGTELVALLSRLIAGRFAMPIRSTLMAQALDAGAEAHLLWHCDPMTRRPSLRLCARPLKRAIW